MVGHRRRAADLLDQRRVMRVLAADHLVEAPGVGGARVAGERRAQRDHATRELGHFLGHLACVQAAQAPADQADLFSVPVGGAAHQLAAGIDHAVARAEIEALLPGVGAVAQRLEQATQGCGGHIGGTQAGEDDHRMAVAMRQALQPRHRRQQRGVLPRCAAFHQPQPRRGGLQPGLVEQRWVGRFLVNAHRARSYRVPTLGPWSTGSNLQAACRRAHRPAARAHRRRPPAARRPVRAPRASPRHRPSGRSRATGRSSAR